jgi:hypothetical protein
MLRHKSKSVSDSTYWASNCIKKLDFTESFAIFMYELRRFKWILQKSFFSFKSDNFALAQLMWRHFGWYPKANNPSLYVYPEILRYLLQWFIFTRMLIQGILFILRFPLALGWLAHSRYRCEARGKDEEVSVLHLSRVVNSSGNRTSFCGIKYLLVFIRLPRTSINEVCVVHMTC